MGRETVNTVTIIFDGGDRILAKLTLLEELLMTSQQIIDKLAADFAATSTRVGGQIDTLKSQMAALQQQLASQDVSPETQAAADALDNAINSFQVPPPPDVPTPDPNPTPAPAPGA